MNSQKNTENLSSHSNKPTSMYNSDCSSSCSISSNEVFVDPTNNDDDEIFILGSPQNSSKSNKMDGSTDVLLLDSKNKWSSHSLISSTPKSDPPVPKVRRNIPVDVKKVQETTDNQNGYSKVIRSNSVSTPQDKNMNYYRNEDASKFFTPPENIKKTARENLSSVKKPPRMSKKRMSLDENDLIDVEKLEMALNHLGIDPSSEQWNTLMDKVKIEPNGLVKFGEVIKSVREVFQQENGSFHSTNNNSISISRSFSSTLPENQKMSIEFQNEENKKLKDLIGTLEEKLIGKDKKVNEMDEKLSDMKKMYESSHQDNIRLKDELESAKKSTVVTLEHDYGKIAENYLNGIPDKELNSEERRIGELQKRVAILTCQLRKLEVINKTYEVTSNQLLHFADEVRSTDFNYFHSLPRTNSSSPSSTNPSSKISQNKNKRVSRAASLHSMPPPPYPGHRLQEGDDDSHKRLSLFKRSNEALSASTIDVRATSVAALPNTNSLGSASGVECRPPAPNIVDQAKKVISLVRNLLHELPLPDGWEEGYTPDGNKFYIHHLTQTTSWINPISKMAEKNRQMKDSRRSSVTSEISWV